MRVSLMSLGDLIEDPITGWEATSAQRHLMPIDAAVVTGGAPRLIGSEVMAALIDQPAAKNLSRPVAAREPAFASAGC